MPESCTLSTTTRRAILGRMAAGAAIAAPDAATATDDAALVALFRQWAAAESSGAYSEACTLQVKIAEAPAATLIGVVLKAYAALHVVHGGTADDPASIYLDGAGLEHVTTRGFARDLARLVPAVAEVIGYDL